MKKSNKYETHKRNYVMNYVGTMFPPGLYTLWHKALPPCVVFGEMNSVTCF